MDKRERNDIFRVLDEETLKNSKKDVRSRSFLFPKRILWTAGQVENSRRLLEKEEIAIDDEEGLKEFALASLYKQAERSRLSMSAVEWSSEVVDQPQCPIVIVMDEVLFKGEEPLSYHKYRMDSNWYRFTLDRRL